MPAPCRASTAREWASRSITQWPSRRQLAATVVLPDPMPPVSPIRHGASCTSMRRSYGPAGQSGHEGVQRGRGAVYGAGGDPLELLITNDFLRVLDLRGVFIMGVAS